jgi:peptidoglycan/xylan/chitin deacetylase (PgdA/CDA1 family)
MAYPILRRYGLPATIFLTTAYINQTDVPWNDKVAFALKATTQHFLVLQLPEGNKQIDLRTTQNRLVALNEILWFLRTIPHSRKLELLDDIFHQLKIHDFSTLYRSMLSWDQVREMRCNRIAFGAHTMTHPILKHAPRDTVEKEIRGSKEQIQKELDEPVDLFAYPNGTRKDFNESHKVILKELGFKAAFTTFGGLNTPNTDFFELRRGGPYEHTALEFAFKLAFYRFVH